MWYDIAKIKEEFIDLVGWRNDEYDSNVPALLTPYDQAPLSGQYYNDAHPLLTLENLFYTCQADSPTEANFNSFLVNFIEQVIEETVNRLFLKKKLSMTSKEILDRGVVYRSGADYSKKELPQGRFAGWAFALAGFENATLKIHRVGTHFTSSVPELTLYLFHISKQESLSNLNVELIANSFKWTASGLSLSFSSENHNSGGFYLLGYFEDDLGGSQAINERLFTSTGECANCSGSFNYRRINDIRKYFQLTPFTIESEHLNGNNIPTLGDGFKNITATPNSLGLNMDISVVSDATQTILDHKNLFIQPLRLMAVYKALYFYLKTQRINATANVLKKQAAVEIYDQNTTKGVIQDMEEQFKAFEFDFSDLKSPSFPKKKRGISRGAM